MSDNLQMEMAMVFMGELAFQGVKDAVLSPGSRSTPLALAALSSLRCHVAEDERSAAFFALGQARRTGRPTVLVCTSGTAGAHYLPALMEADLSCIPLIAVTADRPWEAQSCGANQTVFQQNLFGTHVRRFLELGEPSSRTADAARRIAARTVTDSVSPVPGPVHVNARWRMPLEPRGQSVVARKAGVRVFLGVPGPDGDAVGHLAEVVARCRRGWIVCGPLHCMQDRQTMGTLVSRLSEVTGYPVFTGVTGPFVDHCDGALRRSALLLSSPSFRRQFAPDLIIEVNGPLVSSDYGALLEEADTVTRVVLTPYSWVDPDGRASAMVIGPLEPLLSQFVDAMAPATDRSWMESLRAVDAAADAVIAQSDTGFSEATVSRVVAEWGDGTLLVGNSLTVRDMDAFGGWRGSRVMHQRGASGIDGLISAAAGSASAGPEPLTLLIGDMSARHDIGGFALHWAATAPLVTVIVNNDGGRMFEQLPVASQEHLREALELAFVVPGGPSFEFAARMHGLGYARVSDESTLRAAYQAALQTGGSSVIEAVVAQPDSRQWRGDLAHRVDEAVKASLNS